VSNYNIALGPRSEPAHPVSAPAQSEAGLTEAVVTTAATFGVVAAGVALLEVALIPGLVIGGAAVLAPKYFSSKYLPNKVLPLKYLPGLSRSLGPMLKATFRRRNMPAALPVPQGVTAPLATLTRSPVKLAIAKTVTFRIIVTTLDFSVNYLVLGELATAAGLSAFSLVVGPLFYLAHETVWNHPGIADKRIGLTVLLPWRQDARTSPAARSGFTISRALAKTITFRTIATTTDFTANFVVVGDLATAAALSASGFILGPFIYFGHERAWDHFSARREQLLELPALTDHLPALG